MMQIYFDFATSAQTEVSELSLPDLIPICLFSKHIMYKSSGNTNSQIQQHWSAKQHQKNKRQRNKCYFLLLNCLFLALWCVCNILWCVFPAGKSTTAAGCLQNGFPPPVPGTMYHKGSCFVNFVNSEWIQFLTRWGLSKSLKSAFSCFFFFSSIISPVFICFLCTEASNCRKSSQM